jgi:hypothetical protein
MIAQPIVFPDTNVFLHYRAIDQIDWLMLIKARPIQIKIAPVVGRELVDAAPATETQTRAGQNGEHFARSVGFGSIQRDRIDANVLKSNGECVLQANS